MRCRGLTPTHSVFRFFKAPLGLFPLIMRCRWVSVLSLLGAVSLRFADPTPLWDDMLVKHMWDAVPANWESLGHPPAGTTIDLHIALEPHRKNALIDALYEVSDPKLPTYGAHLTREQVAKLVAPHPESLGLVTSWLEHHGVSSSIISITHGGGWLTVTGVPVSQANELLGASYQLYRHTGTNKTILRTVGYALPAALHAHVQTVAPTTYFSPARVLQQTPRKYTRKGAPANKNATSGKVLSDRAGDWVMPEFLRWLYNTRGYVPAAAGRNVLGVAGYSGQSASQGDLTTFMGVYRYNAEDATFTVVKVNGGWYDPRDPSVEASMNIQYAEGITYPTPHIFYCIGGGVEWSERTKQPIAGDADLGWFRYLLSQRDRDIPQTISISYDNPELELPREYARTLCDLFAQLGARGVSVLIASGDYGVGKGNCEDRYGKVQFDPMFPASCPWVTSVGGTTGHDPEKAASLSGGGFSFHFPRPSYQDGVVPAFLQHLDRKHAGYYNPNGRGIPDISAQAVEFMYVLNGDFFRIDGTSCSTPTVAGIISLLNDYLLASGKAPLGFLNPWLYGQDFAGLNDITSGSNPGCDTDGFSAIVGWDPVTGLGTPDFAKLQRTLANRANTLPHPPLAQPF